MKYDWLPERGMSRWLEPAFAVSILSLVGYSMWFLYTYEYMPQPFFYDANDTFMDWFNTAYWARDPGTYDFWGSIYPPLSFVFLRIFGIDRCYTSYPPLARSCDWLGIVTIYAFYLINVLLISMTYLKVDRRTALFRSIALAAGLPMLFTLDRGNLLIVTFAFFLLGYGPLLRSARWRWLCVGIAINFKVYLIGSIFAELLRRRWRWFEGSLLAVMGVYLVSYGIYGKGAPGIILDNLTYFSTGGISINYFDLWYTGTYHAVLSLLDGPFPMLLLIGSRRIEFWTTVLPIAQHITQGMIILACVAAWLRPEVVPMHRLTYFAVAMALLTSEAGGYTQLFMLYLIFFEGWRGFGRKFAIIVTYILCLPADYVMIGITPIWQTVYLTNTVAPLTYGVAIGLFARPGLLMALAIALSLVTIRDVWADIRTKGWHTRRRFRWELLILTRPGPREAARVDQSLVTRA